MRSAAAIALAAALVMVAMPAGAQLGAGCTLEATPVSFGTYDVYSASPLDSTGTVTARCLLGIGVTIGLSTGGAGSFAPRRLANGGASLQYNLYTDAARSTVWGSGAGSTATVSILLQALVAVNRTVHARVFPAQDVPAGLYGDSVTVSFVF